METPSLEQRLIEQAQDPNDWVEPIRTQATTRTPWGQPDSVYKFGPGVRFYSCAGHGGYRVSGRAQRFIPEPLRRQDRWYEGDCDWAAVAVGNPNLFTKQAVRVAIDTLNEYYPEQWKVVCESLTRPANADPTSNTSTTDNQSVVAVELRCEMDADCDRPIAMIDNKGYIYCGQCGIERRQWRPCRKLRPHELNRLARGEQIKSY